eukprot:5481400-Amphidinium_carterae.1
MEDQKSTKSAHAKQYGLIQDWLCMAGGCRQRFLVIVFATCHVYTMPDQPAPTTCGSRWKLKEQGRDTMCKSRMQHGSTKLN